MGKVVTISGVLGSVTVNGTWVVTSVPTATTFTIALSTAPAAFAASAASTITSFGSMNNAVTLSGSNITFTGTVNLNAANTTLTVNDLATAINGNFNASGGNLTKQGTGTLSLAGTNTAWTGGLIVGGILQAQASNAIGQANSVVGSNVIVANNATLQVQQINAAGSLTIPRNLTVVGSGYTAGGATGAIEMSGGGNGVNTISGSITLLGDTQVDVPGGQLSVTATNGIVVAGTTVAASATVTLASTNGLGVGMAISAQGIPVNEFITAILSSTQITITTGVGVTAVANSLMLFSYSFIGAAALTKVGAGVLSINAAGNYNGTTTISGGILLANATSANRATEPAPARPPSSCKTALAWKWGQSP